MAEFITLSLKALDVGQILDGLEQRRIVWQATAEYLANDSTEVAVVVEECSNSYEAQAVADYYQHIIATIKQQWDKQLVQNGNAAAD